MSRGRVCTKIDYAPRNVANAMREKKWNVPSNDDVTYNM